MQITNHLQNFENHQLQSFENHQRKMAKVHDEFSKTAKIQGLVSYIYYPKQLQYTFSGHAELEVEGTSWTLMKNAAFSAKSLSHMIRSSKFGTGYPFFRFNIVVTPNQLIQLRKNIEKTRSFCCSHGALSTLSRNGAYSVPLPFTISPLIGAAYLVTAKALNADRIKKIQFFGGENKLTNLSDSVTGVLYEFTSLVVLATFVYVVTATFWAVVGAGISVARSAVS